MALDKNGSGEIYCVEPYPKSILKSLSGIKLFPNRVQDMDINFFKTLQANDILFIDSTHTVKLGGDVTYLILEILPRLAPGVIVHFHDIFLPDPYPENWYLEQHRFWMEQYLLQAYLVNNSRTEVLFANHYASFKYASSLQSVFPKAVKHSGSSFWLRVKE
jgi:hypothetical protein